MLCEPGTITAGCWSVPPAQCSGEQMLPHAMALLRSARAAIPRVRAEQKGGRDPEGNLSGCLYPSSISTWVLPGKSSKAIAQDEPGHTLLYKICEK